MNTHPFTSLCSYKRKNEILQREICNKNYDSILIENIVCGLKRKNKSVASQESVSENTRENMQNENIKEEIKNKSSSSKIFDIQQIPKKIPKNNIVFNNFKVKKVLIKLGSKLTYSFNAAFNKKSFLDLETIELKGFMNKMQKTIFLQNLKILNQKHLLKDYLKFNTISAFDEIGEINTQAKKLSALLSMRKIGMQFLLIKNINFQNKLLILFYKDSFPFKDYYSTNDFYILKMDQDFIKKNIFFEFQAKNSLNQKSLGGSKSIVLSNLKSLKLRSNLLKKGNIYINKITSRLINNKFHAIEKRFQNRKIHKIQPFNSSPKEILMCNSSIQDSNSVNYLKNNLTCKNKIFNYFSYYENPNFNEKFNIPFKCDSDDFLLRKEIKGNAFCNEQHSTKFNSKENVKNKYQSKPSLFKNKIKVDLESFEIIDESSSHCSQNRFNFEDYMMAAKEDELKQDEYGNYNINIINHFDICAKDMNIYYVNRQQQAVRNDSKKIKTASQTIESMTPLYNKKRGENFEFILKENSYQDNNIKDKIEQPLNKIEYKFNHKKCLNCASEFNDNYFVDYGSYFLCAKCLNKRKNEIKKL